VPPIGTEERLARIDRAQRRMREIGVPALWLDGTTDLEYFTGVRHGQTERMIGALLPAHGMPVYVCPAFEAAKLRTMLTVGDAVRGWEEDESPYALFLDTLRDLQIHSGTIALDEQARFFVTEGIRAAAAEAGADYRWTTSRAVSSWCRQRKSEHEIALIRQAMRLTLDIQAAAARILRPGITTTEVAAFLNEAHLRAGFDRGCLFAIALFGEATAYPHGVPPRRCCRRATWCWSTAARRCTATCPTSPAATSSAPRPIASARCGISSGRRRRRGSVPCGRGRRRAGSTTRPAR
jgi:Xaa-Pro dipeptidase